MSRLQSLLYWFPVTPTLSEWRGGRWEVLGGEDLELDASVDRLEAGGEMQLSVTHLENDKIVNQSKPLASQLKPHSTD